MTQKIYIILVGMLPRITDFFFFFLEVGGGLSFQKLFSCWRRGSVPLASWDQWDSQQQALSHRVASIFSTVAENFTPFEHHSDKDEELLRVPIV